jgi:hypothetical protein
MDVRRRALEGEPSIKEPRLTAFVTNSESMFTAGGKTTDGRTGRLENLPYVKIPCGVH